MGSDSEKNKKRHKSEESENLSTSLSILSEPSCSGVKAAQMSQAELDELDAFCSSFDCEDISFDDWVDCVNDLDLKMQIKLSICEVKDRVEYPVQYTTCDEVEGKKKKTKRELRILVADLPLVSGEQREFVFKGRGDKTAEKNGDLFLTVVMV